MRLVLRIAAVVLFVVAAIAAFGHADLNVLGLVAVGLACWCAATLVGANWLQR